MRSFVAQLRAAHALAFAVTAGQTPDRADLEAAGLGGVTSELFGNRTTGDEGENTLQAELAKVAQTGAPSELTASWNGCPERKAA